MLYIRASAIIGTSVCTKWPANYMYDVNKACEDAEESELRKAQQTNHYMPDSKLSDHRVMAIATEKLREHFEPYVLAWLIITEVDRGCPRNEGD
jgi:hypothetical protein